MKRGFLFFLGLVLFQACGQQTAGEREGEGGISPSLIDNPMSAGDTDLDAVPVLTFDQPEWDFGTISQGEKVSISFTFTNTGKADLIISTASGSCGCTVPSWPEKPVKPGGKGKIDVVFDSEGKSGRQSKTVTVLANTQPNRTVIKLFGEIIAPEKSVEMP